MKHAFAENQVSERVAAEADAAARTACVESKFLCRMRRDQFVRTLVEDPNLTPADREARQQTCDELEQRLVELEAAYPGERRYEPPPKITAKRTIL